MIDQKIRKSKAKETSSIIWGIIFGLVAFVCDILFLFYLFSREDKDEIGLFLFFFILAFGETVLTVHFFRTAHKLKQARKLFPKIKKQVIRNNKPVAISELASFFHVSEVKMLKRLDAVLDAGYLPDMYIDYSIRYLMFKEDLSNENLNYEYLKDDPFVFLYCSNCGATNKLHSKQNGICQYCGWPV